MEAGTVNVAVASTIRSVMPKEDKSIGLELPLGVDDISFHVPSALVDSGMPVEPVVPLLPATSPPPQPLNDSWSMSTALINSLEIIPRLRIWFFPLVSILRQSRGYLL
jgi:hypothetical protein